MRLRRVPLGPWPERPARRRWTGQERPPRPPGTGSQSYAVNARSHQWVTAAFCSVYPYTFLGREQRERAARPRHCVPGNFAASREWLTAATRLPPCCLYPHRQAWVHLSAAAGSHAVDLPANPDSLCSRRGLPRLLPVPGRPAQHVPLRCLPASRRCHEGSIPRFRGTPFRPSGEGPTGASAQ